jgi:hypothetical protein
MDSRCRVRTVLAATLILVSSSMSVVDAQSPENAPPNESQFNSRPYGHRVALGNSDFIRKLTAVMELDSAEQLPEVFEKAFRIPVAQTFEERGAVFYAPRETNGWDLAVAMSVRGQRDPGVISRGGRPTKATASATLGSGDHLFRFGTDASCLTPEMLIAHMRKLGWTLSAAAWMDTFTAPMLTKNGKELIIRSVSVAPTFVPCTTILSARLERAS